MFAIMSAVEFDKQVKSIGTRSAKLKKDIQTLATHAVMHNLKHGDPHYMNKLLSNVSGAVRKDSLVAFFEKFGKAKWDADKETMVYLALEGRAADDETAAIVEAFDWTTARKQTIKSVYDPLDAFTRMMTVMAAKAKKGEIKTHEFVQGILEEAKDKIDAVMAADKAKQEAPKRQKAPANVTKVTSKKKQTAQAPADMSDKQQATA